MHGTDFLKPDCPPSTDIMPEYPKPTFYRNPHRRYLQSLKPNCIAAIIALERLTPENGLMEVGVEQTNYSNFTHFELNAGDVLLFDGELPVKYEKREEDIGGACILILFKKPLQD
jgi:hypothetical protein